MGQLLEKEYKSLLIKKLSLEKELSSLPTGYISVKTIKGKQQYYLQHREGTRIVGKYIRSDDVHDVKQKIDKRKTVQSEIVSIGLRLSELEQAAKLIDKNLFCRLGVYRMSAGMDELSFEAKNRCSSFGFAMNSIEGIIISKETSTDLEEWKNGERSFLSVFDNTLKRYGFPVEK